MHHEQLNTPESQTQKKRRVFSFSTLAGFFIVVAIFSSLFGALFGFMASESASFFFPRILQKIEHFFPQSAQEESTRQQQKIIEDDSAVISVVDGAMPAVVSIIVTKDIPQVRDFFDQGSPFSFDPFSVPNEHNNDGEVQQEQIGGGTGFLVSSDGMIVTNKHVVADRGASYTVVTNDGKEHAATILARDPVLDIAILDIDGEDFPVLTIGNSDAIKIGQTVIAIGNSLGEFANTVSRGIISGLKRNIVAGSQFGEAERLTDIIQTDAAINFGNSGGPLLDIQGRVVAVNIAIAQGAENIGFALPINQVNKIIMQVKETGKISQPFLGVRYIIVNKDIQRSIALPFDYGALIVRGDRVTDFAVVPGSPADKVGIVENDIILEVDGEKVTQDTQLGDILVRHNAGDTITLKVWHRGEASDKTVILEERTS